MTTLLFTTTDVHKNLCGLHERHVSDALRSFVPIDADDDLVGPDESDLAWYSENLAPIDFTPEPIDDLDWLLDELDQPAGPLGVGTVVAAAIAESVGHLGRHGFRSIHAYGKPAVGYTYEQSRPSTFVLFSPRRSQFARELDAVAAWYAHLETSAGLFAAAAVQNYANHAAMLGSKNAAEFARDDARYEAEMEVRAAMLEEEDSRIERLDEEMTRWGRV